MTQALSDQFFEALGEPKPGAPFDILDAYRFNLCLKQLAPGSVLDVGAYLGDFLKLVINDGRSYYGTEVNQARVDLVNSILGSTHVSLDFRNGSLKSFEDNFVDNVVCMETIEHVIDHQVAIEELCRVSRKRVVITVPYLERLEQVLCTHCNSYTPHHGHQHSYDQQTFKTYVPTGWKMTYQRSFARRVTRMTRQVLPKGIWVLPVLRAVDLITPGNGRWLIVVLDKV